VSQNFPLGEFLLLYMLGNLFCYYIHNVYLPIMRVETN